MDDKRATPPKLTLAQLLEERERLIAELHAAQQQVRDDYNLPGADQSSPQKEKK